MGYLLEVKNIVKRFGGLVAVDNVSLGVNPGEVVALLGDNGAGKSTLIKVISGVHSPEEGEILFDGKPVTIETPMDALSMGIETIYQDLALAENLNVYSNIFLGREITKKFAGFIPVLDHNYMHSEAQKVLDTLVIKIPSLRARIKSLSGGQRQAVAISRSLYWKAKLLIMDEPTAALGVAQQSQVLELVDSLKHRGIGIILISHTMFDVFKVADRIVVLRRGQKVADKKREETSPDEIVSFIVGADSVQ